MSRELSPTDFVTARPLDEVGMRLLAAAEIIRKHGWCQGRFQTESGEVCVSGAMILACGGRLPLVPREFYHNCHDRISAAVGTPNLAHWNDYFARTKEQVIAALENAAWSAP